MSVCLRTKWLWIGISWLSVKKQISSLFLARSSLAFEQLNYLILDPLWQKWFSIRFSWLLQLYFSPFLTLFNCYSLFHVFKSALMKFTCFDFFFTRLKLIKNSFYFQTCLGGWWLFNQKRLSQLCNHWNHEINNNNFEDNGNNNSNKQ